MLLDDILDEIGAFGRYQRCIYVLLGLVGIPTGIQNVLIAFLAPSVPHWCHVEQLENLTHTQQRYIAIPPDEQDPQHYSQCQMFDLNYSAYSLEDYTSWNRSQKLDNETGVVPCGGWVYDQSHFRSTAASQMSLVCDDAYKAPIIQTVFMAGVLVGVVLFGQISDRIGRYKTLVISLVLSVVFAVISVFVNNYIAYVIMRFMIGATIHGGAFTTAFVIDMEIIGPRPRLVACLLYQSWFSIGVLVLTGMAYILPDTRNLQLVAALLPILLWLSFFVIPESPRWLINMGKDHQATKILNRMALKNRTVLPENLELDDNRNEPRREKPLEEENTGMKKHVITDLLKTPNMRRNTLIMWFGWFTVSLVWFGLMLGVGVLVGNIFLNCLLLTIAEVPAYLVVGLVVQKVGRRWPTIVCFAASGISLLVAIPLIDREGWSTVLIVCLMIGKFFSAMQFALLYVYAAELFPTVVRQVGIGSSSMCARLAALLQPLLGQLGVYWFGIPFLIYGTVSLVAAITSFFLPETMGRTLPETIEDGENFIRRRTKQKDVGFDDVCFTDIVD